MDQSGGNADRPMLAKAIDRALSGETSGIVCWKIDRFSRNTSQGLDDLERLKAKGGLSVFRVNAWGDSQHRSAR